MYHVPPLKQVLYATAAALLLFVGMFLYRQLYDPHFDPALWVIPAIGCFLWVGLVVWYLLEVDKDTAWLEKLENHRSKRKQIGSSEHIRSLNDLLLPAADEKPAASKSHLQDRACIAVCDELPLYPELDGIELPSWFGRVYFIATYWTGLQTFKAITKLLLEADPISIFDVVTCTIFTVLFLLLLKRRNTQLYRIANFRLNCNLNAIHRNSNFYQFFAEQARDLGLKVIGEYEEIGFSRTIFATKEGDCIAEVGNTRFSNLVRIKTLTNDGIRRETGAVISGIAASNAIVTPAETESLAFAMKAHAERLRTAVQEKNLQVVRWTDQTLDLAHNHRRFRKLLESPLQQDLDPLTPAPVST